MVTLPKADEAHKCESTAASFAELKKLIAAEVPGGDKSDAMKRIEQSLDPTKAMDSEKEMAKIWAARERESPAPEAYAKSLAGQWRELGCATEGTPYVLDGLVTQLSVSVSVTPFWDQSDAAKALASAVLDEEHCPGAHGLPEADKAKLKKIALPAAPQAPKP